MQQRQLVRLWSALTLVTVALVGSAALRVTAEDRVVAIHNHMTTETPRIVFLHYWGVGPSRALATGLKAALATQRP